ncbi:cytokine receptor common subunit gamma isoform X1 [Erythrolamprus reginae]|uniref:cytokine receptor common subunit gamma isoform X1 n=1 Tax=Erythrolamprus reginae TaxID=121349 RepID=UPI00396C9BC5
MEVVLGLLLLLLVAPGKRTAGSPQAKVDCICYNEDYVICDWGSQQKPAHNFSFYYWYENLSNVSECKDYIRKERVNVACRFSPFKLFSYLKMYLNDSRGPSVEPPALRLSTRVRPGRPFNLTLGNLSNHQLLLAWKTPYKFPLCLEHEVRYKSNKDTEFMKHPISSSLEFQIPSVDPKKRYTFYVKSKVRHTCASTDLWSEESAPAFWGQEEAWLSSSVKTVVIPLACLLLVLMLSALLRMERNGPESPKTWWRPSSPATMKTSVPSQSCCPVGATCPPAVSPRSRVEGHRTHCRPPLPRPARTPQRSPPEFGAHGEGGSVVSRAPQGPPTPCF